MINVVLNITPSNPSQPQAQGGQHAQEVVTGLEALLSACDPSSGTKAAIDCYLGGLQFQANTIVSTYIGALMKTKVEACSSIPAAAQNLPGFELNVDKVVACVNSLQAGTSDQKKAADDALMQANADADKIRAEIDAKDRKQVVSTYQGYYGAASLQGLADLPSKFTGASNIVGTWTAGFANNTAPPPVPPAPVPAAPSLKSQAAPNGKTANQNPTPTQNQTQGNQQPLSTAQQATNNAICAMPASKSDAVEAACSHSSSNIHDEELEHWDVSIVAPVTGYKQLTYQASSSGGPNTIGTSTTRATAYGMFDVFPWGQDLNSPPILGIPYPTVGLTFTGAPLDRPYFAVAEMANIQKIPWIGSQFFSKYLPLQLRPVFGWVYVKQAISVPAVGSTPATSRTTRDWHPQFGIEISIRSTASSLTSNSSKSNSTTKKTGS